jgi:hypothetical protein
MFPTFMLVGQAQSTAVNLLRASRMSYSESRLALREVARHSSEERPAVDG